MKTKDEKKSNYIKWEKIGMSIEGTFSGFFTNKHGLSMKLIDKKNNEKMISLGTSNLKFQIANIRNVLVPGKSQLSIMFSDETQNENTKKFGNKIKIFDVFLDGKILTNEAQKEDIDNFFESKE